MAVYERTYKRYAGEQSPRWSRFLIVPRYLLKDVFASRLLLFYFAFCFIFPLFCAGYIFITHNFDLIKAYPQLKDWLAIDAESIASFFKVQSMFGFFLTLFVGPGLVSRDLANNGLALYLSRPFSRVEYVLGKTSVLALLLSAITWVPGFALVALMVGFEGMGWLTKHLGALAGFFALSWVLIAILSMLALSVSAWVRWRPIAGFAMLAFMIGGQMFAAIANMLFRTESGHYFNFFHLTDVLAAAWVGGEAPSELSPWTAVFALGLFFAFFLFLLHRKIRAYEVA
jgi:ABC-2 type transport system permease protein